MTQFALKRPGSVRQKLTSPFTGNKIKETHFKFIHKFYLNRIKLHKISPQKSALDFKPFKEHLFWHCESLKSFWASVHLFTESVSEFDLNPCFYLLHDMPGFHSDNKKCRFLITISNYAKKCRL